MCQENSGEATFTRRGLATPTTLPFHLIQSNFDRLGPQQNLRETPVARQVAAQQQQSKVHRSASAQPIRSINPIRPQLHIRESVNANMLQIRRVLDSPEGRTSLSFVPDASQIFPAGVAPARRPALSSRSSWLSSFSIWRSCVLLLSTLNLDEVQPYRYHTQQIPNYAICN